MVPLLPRTPTPVPAGSPSRGGDVMVYVPDIKPIELALSFFVLFLCLFPSL